MMNFQDKFCFPNEQEFKKTADMIHTEDHNLVATVGGEPQAFFSIRKITPVPCIKIYTPIEERVLGDREVRRMEIPRIEHKPKLLIACTR